MLKKICVLLPLFIVISCATNRNWMRDEGKFIDDKTLGELNIPGTHLSNAYNITSKGIVCTGEAINPQNLSANVSLRQSMMNESIFNEESFVGYLNTQKSDITQQLNDGARYLELQVCQQHDTLYTSNVYLTDKLDNIIAQIDNFVDGHPGEIVIIDLDNNLWADYGAMNATDSTKFYNHIITIIGHNLVPKSMRFNKIGQLKSAHKQVILLSSNPQLSSFPFVWDKTQVAVTAPAQYSTIQKISAIQTIYAQPENINTLNIIPLFSVLPSYSIANGINATNNDDPIILNYLTQEINSHAMVVVTDYRHLDAVIDLTLLGNQNNIPQD